MEGLDAPEALQLDVVSKPAAAGDKRDPERFYCPYPGCNRSFAELWRLKVHYRAPPDIRGSGKERGHGTELTHCPKCGKTLKPGKHHVGCSGGKSAPRQTASKRNRTGADDADEAVPGSPHSKHVRGTDMDGDPHKSWQDFAHAHAGYAMGAPAMLAPLKQEHPEWPPTVPQGVFVGHGDRVSWLPGQVNGFVPQLQPQRYQQPQFPPELAQYAAPGAHPQHVYAQQVPFASIPGYPGQPGVATLQVTTESGQVLSIPANMAGMPPGMAGLPGTLVYHQQPPPPHDPASYLAQAQAQHAAAMHAVSAHAQQQQQQQQHQAGAPAGPPGVHDSMPPGAAAAAAAVAAVGGSGVPGALQHDSGGRPSAPLPPQAAGGAGQGVVDGSAAADVGAAAGGDGGAGAAAGSGAGAKPAGGADEDNLGNVFDDVEEFTRDFGRIPSPPPLPPDFHTAATGGNGMLFNFSQFGQKLPRTQSHTRLDRSLSAVGLGHLDVGLDADVMYDHSDDGDLMQLLFGVPDELPTMATIHLHKWSNEEDEDDDAGEPGGDAAGGGEAGAGAGGGAAGAGAGGAGSGEASAAAGRGASGAGPGPGSDAGAGGAGGGAAEGGAGGPGSGQQQPHQQQQPQQGGGHDQRPLNGKMLHGHDASLAAHAAPGGKALMNGGPGHAGDEHHRDHLLDAETFRLLQSCD